MLRTAIFTFSGKQRITEGFGRSVAFVALSGQQLCLPAPVDQFLVWDDRLDFSGRQQGLAYGTFEQGCRQIGCCAVIVIFAGDIKLLQILLDGAQVCFQSAFSHDSACVSQNV